MLQFNLLPDVKQQYVKARHTKQLVIVISLAVSAVSLAILLLLILTVDVVQKKSLHDVKTDITNYSAQLQKTPNLNEILTVQNQLNTLTSLHNQKPVTSRLFNYIAQVTPVQASISTLNVDYTQNTMTITGEAPTLDVVNTFTDTLKDTTYSINNETKPAFSDVVLSSFGRDSKGATYTISLNFDPAIFNQADNISALTVPNGTSGAQPNLFQEEAGN